MKNALISYYLIFIFNLEVNNILENADMPLVEAFDLNKTRAEKKACCDYSFHSSVFKYDENTSNEMETLVNEKKINSFKSYMAPVKDNQMINDEHLISVLEKCKKLGAIGLIHAENGHLINKKTKEIKELGT